MRKTKNKIYLSEFCTIYLISLIAQTYNDKSELLVYLLPIAEKYIEITKIACQGEMFHLFDSFNFNPAIPSHITEEHYKYNEKFLSKIQRKKFQPKKLTLKELTYLFNEADWEDGYGGYLWANIAQECINLKQAVKKLNLNNILFYLDRLNQLEHNNNLYLEDFTEFDIKTWLNIKFSCSDTMLLNYCSKEVKKIYTRHMKGY